MEDIEFRKQIIKILNRINESLEGIQAALEVIVENLPGEEDSDDDTEIPDLTDET